MKRADKSFLWKILVCMLLAAFCAMSLIACGEEEEVDPDEPEVTTYTVTFDTNGGSEIDSQEVEEGGYATQPEDPTKTDYIFNGWYKDSELTTSFEFDTEAITEDTTIYAGWASEDDSTTCTATFYWNYDGAPDDGIYYTKTFVNGGKLTKPSTDPTRTGYSFEGWYMDTGFETAFVNNSVYEGNQSIYARWMYSYTFEAEDTQLTGLDTSTDLTTNSNGDKLGVGFSSNFSGLSLIGSDSAASNGMAVHGLYYEGAYLDFEFTSDKAETGATVRLRIAAEYREVTLTSSTFQVIANGTALTYKYGDIVLDGSDYNDGIWDSGSAHAYSEIVINSFDIVEGENLIRLYVNNNDGRADGTVEAMAPIVDCIYVNSSSELEMTTYDNY